MKMPNISARQHRYYRHVVLPALQEYMGYESEYEAHRAVKAGFYGMREDDPRLPSMAHMTKEEASRFLWFAIRQAAEAGLQIQEPGENLQEAPC